MILLHLLDHRAPACSPASEARQGISGLPNPGAIRHVCEPSARKRVLMLLENSIYPHDSRVLAEATALTEAGYQVTVICACHFRAASL